MLCLEYHPKGSKGYELRKRKVLHSKYHYNIKVYSPPTSKLRKCIECDKFVIKSVGIGYIKGMCMSCHIFKNKEKYAKKNRLSNHTRKIKAFNKIQSKIECVRCGCNDLRLLEVNHKNGDGRKNDYDIYGNGHGLYQDIVKDRRKVEDLELLCRPCNAIHYLELKYGKLPMKIIWEKQ